MIKNVEILLASLIIISLTGCATEAKSPDARNPSEDTIAIADPYEKMARKNVRLLGETICGQISVEDLFNEPTKESVKDTYEGWVTTFAEGNLGEEWSRGYLSKLFVYSAEAYCPDMTTFVLAAVQ